MDHADRLIQRIIFLEGHPNLQKLDPPRIGQNTRETLEADLAGEHDARNLYLEARQHCAQVNDRVSKSIFDDLIKDEDGHIDILETQLQLMDELGAQNYGLLNAKPANEAE